MELRQLAYLVEVVRAGTYSAAAASLSIAQPALWRQVKDLERELGIPLFERVGRRARITRAGQAVVDEAKAVLTASEHLRQAADDIRTGRTGLVSIACAAPHLRAFLAPVIAELLRSRPGIEVRVREYSGGPGPGPGMKADLLAGTVDLATGVGPAETGIRSFPIYDTRLLIAIPDDHPWRDESLIDVERLHGVPLVVSQEGSFSRGTIVAACRRAGFEPTIGFDSPNPLSVLALGAAGLGVPVLQEGAAPAPVARPWPVLAEGGLPITNATRLAWRSGAPPSAAVAAFIELARAEAARRDPGTITRLVPADPAT